MSGSVQRPRGRPRPLGLCTACMLDPSPESSPPRPMRRGLGPGFYRKRVRFVLSSCGLGVAGQHGEQRLDHGNPVDRITGGRCYRRRRSTMLAPAPGTRQGRPSVGAQLQSCDLAAWRVRLAEEALSGGSQLSVASRDLQSPTRRWPTTGSASTLIVPNGIHATPEARGQQEAVSMEITARAIAAPERCPGGKQQRSELLTRLPGRA
jgi:hypothetical protein